MSFTVHILGEAPIVVNDRMDAMYHLGAKYGAVVYNKAVKEGLIIFEEHFVKVTPFKVEKKNNQSEVLGADFKLIKL